MKSFSFGFSSKSNKNLTIILLICIIMLGSLPSSYAIKKKSYIRKQHNPEPLVLASTKSSTVFPRISEFHGLAYDMFTGNPKGETVDPGFQAKAVFELTYDKELKTGDDLFYVPDQVTVVGDMSCSLASVASTYFGMNSYQSSLRVGVGVNGGYDGWGVSAAFSLSAEYNEMKSSMQEEEKVAVVAEAQCMLYHSQLKETANLSQDFKDAIARAFRTKSFAKVVEQWGTHYAHEVEFGATALQRTLFTRKAVEDLSSMGIDVGMAASFSGWGAEASMSAKVGYSKEQMSKYESTSREVKESYIGLAPPESGDPKEWMANIRSSHPVPVAFKLTPIINVFTKDYFYDTYTTEELRTIKLLFNSAVNTRAARLNLVGPSENIFDTNKTVRYSDAFGAPVTPGATGYFKDTVYTSATMTTKCINARGTTFLEMIQVVLLDGATTTNQPVRGSQVTGNINSFCYDGTKKVIDYIVVAADANKIVGIEFVLNDGTKSPRYGGIGGTETRIEVKGHLIGLEGMANTTNVLALRLITRNTQSLVIPGFSQLTTTRAGSDNGVRFRDLDRPLPDFRTKLINVWVRDSKLEGIQAVLTTPDSDEDTPSEINGMTYGDLYTFEVPAGQYMKSVTIWFDDNFVKGIQFTLINGTQSPIYGISTGTGISSKSFVLVGHLTGFFGYHTRFLRSLGVMYVLNL